MDFGGVEEWSDKMTESLISALSITDNY